MTAATINHTERAHALLSPSAAERWTACTPSARLGERHPDTPSAASAEGTKAHELCQMVLEGDEYDPAYYDEEMLECAEAYRYYIQDELGLTSLHVEERVEIPGVPECFGTVDCYAVKGSTLYVIDYKYGMGVAVPAIHNKQLALYAYGILKTEDAKDAQEVRMTIFQPRTDELKEWHISADELTKWVEHNILPMAKAAYEGTGRETLGDHCRFCKAKTDCRAQIDMFAQVLDAIDAQEVTDEDKLAILDRADDIIAYINALKDEATDKLMDGRPSGVGSLWRGGASGL